MVDNKVAVITFCMVILLEQSLRVCLFGDEIEWMENFGEKMGRNTFLECIWLEEGK